MSTFTLLGNKTTSEQEDLIESDENQQFLYSIYNAFENNKSLTQIEIIELMNSQNKTNNWLCLFNEGE
jgi:hypothetical protein